MSKKKEPLQDAVYSNKVFQVLGMLSQAEKKRLAKFLDSPFFNQSQTLSRLFELLSGYIDEGKPGFDRQAIWNEMFKGQPYEDVNFRKFCSDLLMRTEEFLAHNNIYENDMKLEVELLDHIIKKKIEPLFNSTIKRAVTRLEKQPYNASSYLDRFVIEKHYYKIRGYDDKVMNERLNLEKMSEYLDLFYIIEKLKVFSIAFSQKMVMDYSYALTFVDETLALVQKYDLNSIPELAAHYYAFQILRDEDNEEHYYNLKKNLEQYSAFIPQTEAIDLFESAMNYCTIRLNKGNLKFLEEYFELVQIALDKNVLIINNEITVWRYNNFVGAALRLGKEEWAEKFIEKYKDNLPEDTRQNTYSFNLARVYRYQKKYNQVMSLLRNVEYEDIGYNLISKAMLTITYYELEEYDALDSFSESFRVFLNRHKNIPNQRRQGYLNLIKFVRRLTRLAPGDRSALAKLRQEVQREKEITVNYEWLLEKITELE